jgi:hypothetical protein
MMFVEDPGAANYAADVPEVAARRGLSIRLCASGLARATLDALGFRYEQVGLDTDMRGLRAVLVGTAEAADARGLALIDEAKQAGIPAIGFVDGPANPAFRFRGRSDNPLQHAPDWLAVPDEGTRERFIAVSYPSDRVRACGHPFHDRVRALRADFCASDRHVRRAALWPDAGRRKVIVFAAELSSGLEERAFRRSAEYSLSGTSGSDLRTDIVLEEFLLAVSALKAKPYLVLRLHPKTPRATFARYLDAFDAVSEGGAAGPILDVADAVVGLTSVVLDEAALLGRPVLSIVPRERERVWLIGAMLGVVPMASRRDEILSKLKSALAGERTDPAAIDALIKPGAADNVVDLIETAIAFSNENHADDPRRHHA